MGVNRGKQFESCVRESIERIHNTSIDRLIDPQNGFAGVRNICDFIAYSYPFIWYLECKSCYGNTLPFSNITQNQWYGLIKKSDITGVHAGYIVWFIDHDMTYFVSAHAMQILKAEGKKSLHIKDAEVYGVKIPGKKKRVLFEYDFRPLLKG